ncbi:MAG: DUF4268 domain-containing protein [Thermosipho sp. (in: Bacteria)]|nr:DUF4268 domain-containing protein [Thermosipho sp. (in: thermotogales)]
MKIQQGHNKLLDLLKQAYNGQVMLPDFQRNFVWMRNDIEELIKSLLEDMFIGTFLILYTHPSSVPFKPIFVQGAKGVNPNIKANPTVLILDGQQRLTAMFYAVYSPKIPLRYTETPYEFFINLDKLVEDDIENSVFSWSVKWREYVSYINDDGNLDYQKLLNDKILPVSIFKNKEKYYELKYTIMKKMFSDKQIEKIDSYINNLLDYNIMTLSLDISYNEKPEEIATLFERINKTGIKLSTYDLLTARFYKFIKLREEWEMVFEKKPNIKRLAVRVDNTNVPFSFIQALALSKGKSIKSRDLVKIDHMLLNKENWERVVDIVENKVLSNLYQVSNFGITDVRKWLPYNPLITLLTAFYLKHNYIDTEKINIWYWSAVFTERYSGSTESMMMKDFREVSEWFEDKSKIPEVVEQFFMQLSKDTFNLRNIKRRGSSKYKGIFNLIFKNVAVDFYQPESLTFNNLEDHHIFPKNFLQKKNVNVDYDVVLNRTLIFDETNRKISNKSPAEYLKEMINLQMSKGMNEKEAEQRVKNILKAHFIDNKMYEILKSTSKDLPSEKIKDNFEKFIQRREELIKDEIKKLIQYDIYLPYVNSKPEKLGRHELRKEFWKSLLKKSNKKFDLFSTRNTTVDSWLSKPLIPGVELVYKILYKSGAVELYIDCGKNSERINKKLFDFLYENREQIEKELNIKLEWQRMDDKRASRIAKKFYEGGLGNKESWDNLQENMVNFMVKFYKVISNYIPEMKKIKNVYQKASK